MLANVIRREGFLTQNDLETALRKTKNPAR